MITLTLPWPDRRLSPNARGHWSVQARAKKDARLDAYWIAKSARAHMVRGNALDVRLTFVPPDKRRRDLDNMVASCKAFLDGISDATGIDDSKWKLTIDRAEPQSPGSVKVEIKET